MKARHLFVAFAFVSLSGCGATTISSINASTASTLDRGWECLINSNDLDKVGMVFSIDPSGVRYDHANLTGVVGARDGVGMSSSVSTESSASAGFIASLLKIAGPVDAGASATADARRKFKVETSVAQRREVRADEAGYERVLAQLNTAAFRAGWRYYLIRETIAAEKVSYSLDRNIGLAFGGEANFRQNVAANPNLKFESSSNIVVSNEWPTALTVCIKGQELRQIGGAGAGGAQIVTEVVPGRFWRGE
jgi:hypothetical protein